MPDNEKHIKASSSRGTQGAAQTIANRPIPSLESAEKKFYQLIDQLPLMVAQVNENYRYLFANLPYCRKFNIARGKIKGKRIADVLGNTQFQILQPKIERALKGEQVNFSIHMGEKGEYFFNTTIVPATEGPALKKSCFAFILDISDRKKVEEQLTESEARWRSVFENAPDLILTLNKEYKITSINYFSPTYSADDIIGKDALKITEVADAKKLRKCIKDVFETGKACKTEAQYISALDGMRWTEAIISPVVSNEQVEEVTVISRDVTEKKELLKKYIRSEARWQSIFDSLDDVIVTINKKGEVLSINRTRQGYENEDVIGKKIFHFYTDKKAEIKQKILQAFQTGKSFEMEKSLLGPDRTLRYYHGKYNPIKRNGKVEEMIILSRDITHEKQAEKQKNQAMVEGQDRERERVAQELHDSLGQNLSALKLNLISLEEELKAEKINVHRESLCNIRQLIKEGIEEIRNISHDLMPGLIRDFGIEEALRELFRKISTQTQMDLSLQVKGQIKRYDPRLEVSVYRIAQELVNNTLKHSKARKASLSLTVEKNKLLMTMQDDGIGFDGTAAKKGYGIHNITSRLNLLNGKIKIKSKKGEGAVTDVQIPLNT